MAREQKQFLNVVDRDTAVMRWHEAIRPCQLETETVPIHLALGRVLASDIFAPVDVPPFDRSNVDGFALRAEETFGSAEESPGSLRLQDEELPAGRVPILPVRPGTATVIATGGVLPRGADAVLMVEHARVNNDDLIILRSVAPGTNVSFAGSDMARGELVLREGALLTSRETGMLAAIGCGEILVVRRPVVTILSTGDEIVAPGEKLRPGAIFDANATLLSDAVTETGGIARRGGIIPDDTALLRSALDEALAVSDIVLLSGGTSKGAGDLSYRILSDSSPGIVVHGVSLKPGKPVCLGAVGQVPVAVLPGFPTSAIFTFHEFVAPVIRRLAGLSERRRETISARLAVRSNSERGRTEFLLVGLLSEADGLAAYPVGKGSGSVTTFSRADGFIQIGKNQEYVERGEMVAVTPLGKGLEPADLVVVGSHCVGLDWLLGLVERRGFRCKATWIGSQGGLDAVSRGACDLAGIHLLDPGSDVYNTPFLPEGVRLLRGYGRMQGLVYRRGDSRFEGTSVQICVDRACADADCLMVNRNRGSGTRVLLDGLLGSRRPSGFAVEVRSHNAVTAAVSQARADWGVAIEPVARAYGLEFRPIRVEQYDFAVAESRWEQPAVCTFREILEQESTRQGLITRGFLPEGEGSS